jgi:hypothetical protein
MMMMTNEERDAPPRRRRSDQQSTKIERPARPRPMSRRWWRDFMHPPEDNAPGSSFRRAKRKAYRVFFTIIAIAMTIALALSAAVIWMMEMAGVPPPPFLGGWGGAR